MPQTSKELLDKMIARFGEGSLDRKAERFLTNRGFVLLKSWEWAVPEGKEVSEEEYDCIQFLIEEWDYGGIAKMKEAGK